MKTQIVVARYNEDLSWLENYAGGINTHVYNKGEPIELPHRITGSTLENVGRESHTILTHIVENYGTLADVTIFLQGRIDDLSPRVFDDPQKYLHDALQYGYSAPAYALYGPQHWENIDFNDDKKYQEAWRNGSLRRSNVSLIDYATKHLGLLPLLTMVTFNGCFAASRAAIHQHSILFYKELLSGVSDHSDPIEGHYLERLWCYMFSRNRMLAKFLKLSPDLQGRFRM